MGLEAETTHSAQGKHRAARERERQLGAASNALGRRCTRAALGRAWVMSSAVAAATIDQDPSVSTKDAIPAATFIVCRFTRCTTPSAHVCCSAPAQDDIDAFMVKEGSAEAALEKLQRLFKCRPLFF